MVMSNTHCKSCAQRFVQDLCSKINAPGLKLEHTKSQAGCATPYRAVAEMQSSFQTRLAHIAMTAAGTPECLQQAHAAEAGPVDNKLSQHYERMTHSCDVP